MDIFMIYTTKNYIFFFQTSCKDGHSKKIALEYDLSCIIRKDDFFPQKDDLTTQAENERWSFSKKYTEIWYFLQMFSKDGLFKKDHAGTWSFLYCLKRFYFFPKSMIFFPWTKNQGRPFSRNTWWYDIFCVHAQVLRTWRLNPMPKKNQRWSYPAKIHLRVVDILDRNSTKSSNNSLYFHRNLYRCFHILISSEKTRELNI